MLSKIIIIYSISALSVFFRYSQSVLGDLIILSEFLIISLDMKINFKIFVYQKYASMIV
jgi:hypothetical protein